MTRTPRRPVGDLAMLVFDKLDESNPKTKRQIVEETGLTRSQVTYGLDHLRKTYGEGAVISDQRSHLSTYRLAVNAVEVVEYGEQRSKTWRAQIQGITDQMSVARRRLPGGRKKRVAAAEKVLNAANLILVNELDPEGQKFARIKGDLLRALAELVDGDAEVAS